MVTLSIFLIFPDVDDDDIDDAADDDDGDGDGDDVDHRLLTLLVCLFAYFVYSPTANL